MRTLYRFIIICILSSACNAQSVIVQIDPLYWEASESIDWAALNDMSTPNQTITYKTIAFNESPGIRLGIHVQNDDVITGVDYTGYSTTRSDSTTGNITSAFLAARIANLDNTYQAEQIRFNINYQMLDWDIGKPFQISDRLSLHPMVGLRGGWIYQTVKTSLQGTGISVTENLQNNFTGIGPKVGINTEITAWHNEASNVSLLANFNLAYLAGYWILKDLLHHNEPSTSGDIDLGLGNRHLGALAIQAQVGGNYHTKKMDVSLVYEFNDWFDQAQFFDNATAAHNNDLILQGLTLNMSYAFG